MSYPEARYLGGAGEISATARPAGAAPELILPTTNVHYLATGATTGGDFGHYRWEMAGPPSGPAPHFHRSITESFYVLSGTVGLYDGSGWTDAGPGDYFFVLPGGIHAFRNEPGQPASMLILDGKFGLGAEPGQLPNAFGGGAPSGNTPGYGRSNASRCAANNVSQAPSAMSSSLSSVERGNVAPSPVP
jgi:quercetin dioxygenase-like cupin family protein